MKVIAIIKIDNSTNKFIEIDLQSSYQCINIFYTLIEKCLIL